MDIYTLIDKKRNGLPLSPTEWREVVTSFRAGTIADYQMSALLMAGCINGLDESETLAMTDAIASSGETLNWGSGPYVDKHSTGGVGDKISLICAPIAAAAGCKVVKLSGKGLGHTGGTIDKLHSIPGLRTDLTTAEFRSIVENVGCAIGEARNLAPADKAIYALRDVTATIESIPYITASILSKKFAAGAPSLVFDVKYGDGAFMTELDDAIKLARLMVKIAKANGRRCKTLVTSMYQPLGYAIGNSLEIIESIDTLEGSGPDDVRTLSLAIAAEMVVATGIVTEYEETYQLCESKLDNGDARRKFAEMIQSQDGDESKITLSSRTVEIVSKKNGYISAIRTREVGRVAVLCGAGRMQKEDKIDYGAGVLLRKKCGDSIQKSETLATVYLSENAPSEEIIARLEKAIVISENKPILPKLIALKI